VETIEPSISLTMKLHVLLSPKLRYVGLLWALPTPQTIVAVGSVQEMSHLGDSIANHAYIVVSIGVLESESRCKCNKRSRSRFSFSLSDRMGPPNYVY